MMEPNDSAKTDMLADLIVAQHQLGRLRRVQDLAMQARLEGQWVFEALELCRIHNEAAAYDLWQTHYDQLERLLGCFSQVLHHTARPPNVKAQIARVAKSVACYLEAKRKNETPDSVYKMVNDVTKTHLPPIRD